MAAVIFAHIRQEDSLRDIDMALNSHAGKLYHIGIEQSPKSPKYPNPHQKISVDNQACFRYQNSY